MDRSHPSSIACFLCGVFFLAGCRAEDRALDMDPARHRWEEIMEQDARKGGDPDDGRITRDDGGLVPGFPDSGGFSDPPMPPSPELDRVVLIVPRMTPELDQALVLLVEKGWRVGTSPEDHFEIHDGPILAAWKYEGDRIVRTWIEGDKDPLDVWTLGWLYKGVDERP